MSNYWASSDDDQNKHKATLYQSDKQLKDNMLFFNVSVSSKIYHKILKQNLSIKIYNIVAINL